MTRRLELEPAEARAVRAGRWIRVELGRFIDVPPFGLRTRSALVGRVAGRVVAWANVCLHHPLPLDVTSEPYDVEPGVRAAPMDDAGVHLLCHSHGAIYRPRDGYCVSGPCSGQSLAPLAVEEGEDGTIALVLP